MSSNNKRLKYFMNHALDDLCAKHDISVSDLKEISSYLKRFDDLSDKDVLHVMHNTDKSSLEEIMHFIHQKELSTEKVVDTIEPSGAFVFPAGVPLSARAYPAFRIPVSDTEKENAKIVRNTFESTLSARKALMDFLGLFFDNLEELDANGGIPKISTVLVKFTYKSKKKFNDFLRLFGQSIHSYESSFSDSDMDDILDLLIDNVQSTREFFIELVDIMGDLENDSFVAESSNKYNTLLELHESFTDIMTNQLLSHIDYDILGKIKIGKSLPLNLNKRG